MYGGSKRPPLPLLRDARSETWTRVSRAEAMLEGGRAFCRQQQCRLSWCSICRTALRRPTGREARASTKARPPPCVRMVNRIGGSVRGVKRLIVPRVRSICARRACSREEGTFDFAQCLCTPTRFSQPTSDDPATERVIVEACLRRRWSRRRRPDLQGWLAGCPAGWGS